MKRAAVLAMGLAIALAAAASGHTRPGADHDRLRAAQRPITLQWVGDIALSAQRGLPPGGVARALEPVSRQLHHAQLTLGNLEGTLSRGGTSKCGPGSIGSATCFAFQAPPSMARQLRRLGFGLLNQANNHSRTTDRRGGHRRCTPSGGRHRAHGAAGRDHQLTVGRLPVAFLGFAPYSYDANLLDIRPRKRWCGARAAVQRSWS